MESSLKSGATESTKSSTVSWGTNTGGNAPRNQGGNGNKSNKNGNQSKKNNNSNDSKKFTGHNQDDLKGYVLTEMSSTQDYTAFKERVETMAGTKYLPSVGRSIETVTTLRLADFAPKKPKESDWLIPDPNKPGHMTADEDLKVTANKIYDAQIGEVAKELLRHQRDMEKMYNVVLGQIDNGLKEKIKTHEIWDATSKSKCVIALLTILRDICFQGNRTKVHPPTNFIRALRKLLCNKQKNNDCASYVKSTIEAYEVFRSIGGSIVCPALTTYLLSNNKDVSYMEYTGMSPEERSLIDVQVEQCFLAALIIEGSDTETSTLKETLENDYCLGTKNYPTTTTKALDMLNHFKNSRKPNRSNNNKSNNNRSQRNNKKQHTSDANDDATALVTKGESSDAADLNSRQLLINAVANDDVFDSDYFSFFQYGVLSEEDTSVPQNSHSTTPASLTSTDLDNWDYWNALDWASPDSDADESAVYSLNNHHSNTTSAQYTPSSTSPSHHSQDMRAIISPVTTALPNTVEFATITEDISTLSSVFLPPPPPHWRSEPPQRVDNQCSDDYIDLIDLFDPPPRDTGKTSDKEEQQQGPRSDTDTPTIQEWNGREADFTYSKPIQRLLAQRTDGAVDPAWILLDSESSINLICNKTMVKNIRVAPNNRHMNIHCNSGVARTNLIAELPGFGTVWFYEKGIANVLSLALVTDRYRVTMDSIVDNALHVHRRGGHGTRRFQRSDCNLYYSDTKADHSNVLAITTSEGVKKLYSGLDLRRAKKARDLQERLGLPTSQDLIRIIDNNLIKNIAVTRKDVKIMGEVYGPHSGIIKGKTVRRTPGHVREDISEVPQPILDTYGNIVLCVDVFTINGVQFLHTISRHIRARTTKAIADQKKPTLMRALRAVVGHYTSRGFRVTQIHSDNQFDCLRDDLLSMNPPIQLHCVPAAQHEPTIERSNRTMKENVRSVFASLPVKRLPKRCLIELVYAITFWLNCRTTGVSPTISARELLTGNIFDANEVRFQYMEYIQAHHGDTDNTMKPRADDAVYLRPTGSLAGGFFAYDVNTGQIIRRQTGTSLPMPDTIIKRLEGIAKAENMPQGIVFGDRQGLTTVLDLHTEDAAAEDDDDVTDGSYDPADDESQQSNQSSDESIGEGFIEETGAIAESNERVEEDPGTHRAPDGNTEHDGAEGDEHPEHDNMEEAEDTGETETDPEPVPRPNLRPRVKRTHNKYGANEGFEPSLHTRSFFTVGYTDAVSRLCEEHTVLMLVAAAIDQYNNIEATHSTKQYGVRQGIKIFGEEGVNAVLKELKQFHDRGVISMIDPKLITREMVQQALPYLMFLKRKRDSSIKGRGCADGRRQREYISKEDATSPTVSLYALMLSCLIDAIEQRDVATADIPGAFLQTEMPEDEDVYIRLDGTMAELLCRVDPKLYTKYISGKGGKKVLFGRAEKAIYGTLRAALLFWEKLSGKLIEWGYELNPYDACTANKVIDQGQCTIVWHVDDLKISHRDPKVVDQLIADLNTEFGKTSPLTVTRGKVHDYVGMTIDYTKEGQVTFSMFDYLEEILENLPKELDGCESVTPAGDHLFKVSDESPVLNEKMSERFHHYVAKLLYMSKRARPDIQTAVAFLCTRVKAPDQDDLKKLRRVMSYLKETPFLPLVLGWDQTGSIYWHVDAAFAVHKDMRSHSGGYMTLGKGGVITSSTKQKLNTKSSTEAEIVGVDDHMSFICWARYFLQAQGQHMTDNISDGADVSNKIGANNVLYQDNTSAIKLEKNGKASSTKRTKHINIRYFFITDRVRKGEVTIEYCPTDDMIADYFTKPLQGSKFRKFRNTILGIDEKEYNHYKKVYFDAKASRSKRCTIAENTTTMPMASAE